MIPKICTGFLCCPLLYNIPTEYINTLYIHIYILSLIFSEFLTAFGRGWPFKVSTGDQRHSLVCLLFYFWKPDFEKINHASRPSLRLAEAVLVSTAFTPCPRPRCSLQKTRPERGRSASVAATRHWQWWYNHCSLQIVNLSIKFPYYFFFQRTIPLLWAQKLYQ